MTTTWQDLVADGEPETEVVAAFKHDDDRFLTELIRGAMANQRERLRIRSRDVDMDAYN